LSILDPHVKHVRPGYLEAIFAKDDFFLQVIATPIDESALVIAFTSRTPSFSPSFAHPGLDPGSVQLNVSSFPEIGWRNGLVSTIGPFGSFYVWAEAAFTGHYGAYRTVIVGSNSLGYVPGKVPPSLPHFDGTSAIGWFRNGGQGTLGEYASDDEQAILRLLNDDDLVQARSTWQLNTWAETIPEFDVADVPGLAEDFSTGVITVGPSYRDFVQPLMVG